MTWWFKKKNSNLEGTDTEILMQEILSRPGFTSKQSKVKEGREVQLQPDGF